MKDIKYLGIWMDENCVHLIELMAGPGPVKTKNVLSELKRSEKRAGPGDVAITIDAARETQTIFYEELCTVIKNYDEVLLFGPMEAKTELRNLLRNDPFFLKKRIGIEHTNTMSDAEQHWFVENYFKSTDLLDKQ